jgi:dolichol-phosphate mannosyltransferase
MSECPELSVVAPALDEEANVETLWTEVREALEGVVDGFELIIVDDGSKDSTWQRVNGLARQDSRVRGVRFARNFGHQAAVTAGIDAARGQAVVILDADLQDPPGVIPEMVKLWRDGFEVVYGKREEREGETWFKRLTASVFYRLLRAITRIDIPMDTGDFRLMGPRALAAFRGLPERNRFIRGMVSWIGFPQTAMEYRRRARRAGTTKYRVGKMLRFALDGITSFSFLPLRLATWAGLAVSAFAFLYLVVVLIFRMLNFVLPGHTSLMASILFLGGVQLIMIGMMGEYLARIFEEVKQRPIYVVGETTDDDSSGAPAARSDTPG